MVKVDKHVAQEMQRLRTDASLKLAYVPLALTPGPTFTFAALNTRSLARHVQEVAANHDLRVCDVLVVTESRVSERHCMETLALPMHPHMHSNPAYETATGPVHGTMVYSKVPFAGTPPRNLSTPALELTRCEVDCLLGRTLVVGVYRRSNAPLVDLKSALDHSMGDWRGPAVVMGDFNVDYNGTHPS